MGDANGLRDSIQQLEENFRQIYPHLNTHKNLPVHLVRSLGRDGNTANELSGARTRLESHVPKFTLYENNTRATYVGEGQNDIDSIIIPANLPIPSDCGVYYFEVEILCKGDKGFIGIGLVPQDYARGKLPGWDTGTYGYHGDDGKVFAGSGTGRTYGSPFGEGCTIGCCVDFIDKIVFYTRNGQNQGIAFQNIKGSLYPCVGMRSSGESVRVNFGQRKFQFDVRTYVQNTRNRLLNTVVNYGSPQLFHGLFKPLHQIIRENPTASTAQSERLILLPDDLEMSDVELTGQARERSTNTTATTTSTGADSLKNHKNTSEEPTNAHPLERRWSTSSTTVQNMELNQIKMLNEVVLSHLLHTGYFETAKILCEKMGYKASESQLSMDLRKRLRSSIQEGDMEAAIRVLDEILPGFFKANPHIKRGMEKQGLIEKIRRLEEADSELNDNQIHELMLLSRNLLAEESWEKKAGDTKAALANVILLISYIRISNKQVDLLKEKYFDKGRRGSLYDMVNEAVLGFQGFKVPSAMHTLMGHIATTSKYAKHMKIPEVGFVNLEDFI